MKRSVKLFMFTTSALTGFFVFTGAAGVKILPEATSSVPADLLSNAGFEAPVIEVASKDSIHPTGWLTFTSGAADLISLTTADPRSGKQAVKFASQAAPNFYQGLVQTLSVAPGETYRFSAYVKIDPAHPLKGSVTGQLSIEWYGAAGNEIGRLWSKAWSASFAATDWTKFEVGGEAPPNSAQAHFVIVEKGERQPVAGGIFLVDDVSVERATAP